jgi:hypothetical protein
MCHTRVMPDGSVLKGAQGNIPFDRAMAFAKANALGFTPEAVRHLERMLIMTIVYSGTDEATSLTV